MKTHNPNDAMKLVSKFDAELKALLMTDLKSLKERTRFIAKTNNNNLLPAA